MLTSIPTERLQLFDSTLSSMIERFETEFPECRLPPPAAPSIDIDVDPEPSLHPRSSLIPEYRSEAFASDTNGTSSSPLLAPISRRPSDASLASRQAAEEGRMHRFGQRLRRDVLRPETLDYAHGTTGEETEAQHLKELRDRCDSLTGEDIRGAYAEVGMEGLLDKLGTTAEELRELHERDPEIRKGRLGELLNLERVKLAEGEA